MEQIELREADERGRLMRQAAALYEKKTGGRLPGDYLEAVKAERALLHGLARHGWDGHGYVAVHPPTFGTCHPDIYRYYPSHLCLCAYDSR